MPTGQAPRTVRVLLIDPDSEARQGLLTRMARIDGVEVTGAAADASAGVSFLEERSPDMVLVDLHLKDGDEGPLCAGLRATTDLPIIVLASFMTDERWRVLRSSGATAYLLKHLDTNQFGRELRELAHAPARDGQEG